MLEIDLKSIEENKKELIKLINQYEQTSMNIILELTNSDKNWHDDNSERFFGAVKDQKISIKKFIESIENICNRYETIVTETRNIDKTINNLFYDQNSRSVIIARYDNSISEINRLASRLRGLSTYFCIYGERSSINSEASRIDSIAKQLKSSRDKIEKYFNKLDALETRITGLLGGINVQPIPDLDVAEFLSMGA